MEWFTLNQKDDKSIQSDLFQCELYIASRLPKKIVSQEQIKNDELLSDNIKNVLFELQHTKNWRSQCQVGLWATRTIKPDYHINIMYDEDGIPIYYFVLNVSKKEFVAIWKSLFGTIHYANCKKEFPRHKAIELIRFGLQQHTWNEDDILLLSARLPFEKMMIANNITLYKVDKIPKNVQGATVPAHVRVKDFF